MSWDYDTKRIHKVEVTFSDDLGSPEDSIVQFDAPASQFPMYKSSAQAPAMMCDYLVDSQRTFHVIMPSRRFTWINNYLEGADAEDNEVVWSIINEATADRTFQQFIDAFEFDSHDLLEPSEYATVPDYNGPKWFDINIVVDPPPNDADVKTFLESIGESPSSSTNQDGESDVILSVICVSQTEVRSGMFWGLESNDILQENQPFWIYLHRAVPPTSSDFPTVFCIEIGDVSDTESAIDIWLDINACPKIIDYHAKQAVIEFDEELSRVWNYDSDNKIGIMNVYNRLIVTVNGLVLIYKRPISEDNADDPNASTDVGFNLPGGTIRVFGTNAKCFINLSYMSFAPYAIFAIPTPNFESDDESGVSGNWEGLDEELELSGCVAELANGTDEVLWGVDCSEFSGDGGGGAPEEGDGYLALGTIKMVEGSTFANLNTTYFYIILNSGEAYGIPNCGAPYYFRLKGGKKNTTTLPSGGGSSSSGFVDRVVSCNIRGSTQGLQMARKTAEVKFLLEDGDSIPTTQEVISIKCNEEKVFKGIVTSFDVTNEVGVSYITFKCEDFMYILENQQIINSPIYDGMLTVSAVEDLVTRGGLVFKDSMNDRAQYALKSGPVISESAYRFLNTNTLLDCILQVIKPTQATVFANDDGEIELELLDGGFFSSGGGGDVAIEVDAEADDDVVIGSFTGTTDFNSTYSSVYIQSVDRHSLARIFYNKPAADNKLLYNRPLLIYQPAYGDAATVRSVGEDLIGIFENEILKVNFQILGINEDIKLLSFIEFEGQSYRVTGFSINYNADSNDLTTSIEGSWKGGS